MLVRDIIQEAYVDELLHAVNDLLAASKANNIPRLSTSVFRKRLASQGYPTTTDELVQAINQSGYAASADEHEIFLQADEPEEIEPELDEPEVPDLPEPDLGGQDQVSQMATNQALDDIKS